MNAVMRETGSGAQAFASSLKAIKEAGAGEFNIKVAEFRNTDVERVTSEANKLHVFLATELGADIVKLMGQFAQAVAGLTT